jgi:hypothetical protein
MLTKSSFYEDKISDRYTRLTINKSKRRIIDFTYKTSYEKISSFTHPNVKKKINKKKESIKKAKKCKIIDKHRNAYKRYVLEEQFINQE